MLRVVRPEHERRRGSRLWVLTSAALATSCGGCGGSAIEVNVVVPPGMQVQCADVAASTPPGSIETAGPWAASAGQTYTVAVYPGGSLGKQVEIQAHGYVGSPCDTLVATSAIQAASFDGRIDHVILTLTPLCDGGCTDAGPDGGADAGADGGASDGGPSDGGQDAGGFDGSIGPDAGPGPDAGADGGAPSDSGIDAGADAGCQPGQHCGTQGICTQDGNCVPDFQCTPANLGGATPPPISPAVLLSCGVTEIDTGTSSTPKLTNWCGQLPGFGQVTQSDGRTALLAAMSGFVLDAGSTLRVTGAQPLILLVYGNADVAGTLFAGANGPDGGAASSAACSVGIGGNGTISDRAGGGGGGGGFGVNGAGGGAPAGTGGAAGSRGQAEGAAALAPLRAGCRGGEGASSSGSYGEGGGAVEVACSGLLRVEGTIASPGGGGAGGRGGQQQGGGGGGSGGAILLDAQSLIVAAGAAVTANGGGGGGGGGSVLPGSDANDGLPSSPANARGGQGNGVDSGDGGVGGALAGPSTSGAAGINAGPFFGGGGGGGGAPGRIYVHSCSGSCVLSSSATLSPAPSKSKCP
jgi:hypothetical protein